MSVPGVQTGVHIVSILKDRCAQDWFLLTAQIRLCCPEPQISAEPLNEPGSLEPGLFRQIYTKVQHNEVDRVCPHLTGLTTGRKKIEVAQQERLSLVLLSCCNFTFVDQFVLKFDLRGHL